MFLGKGNSTSRHKQVGHKFGKAAIAPQQSDKEKEMEEAFIIE